MLSNPIGTGERALDLAALISSWAAVQLLPQCPPGRALLYPGVPGGGAVMVGGTQGLHHPLPGQSQPLPLLSTNLPLSVAPPPSSMLVRATGRPHLSQHCVPGSLPSAWVPSLWQRSPNTSAWWD